MSFRKKKIQVIRRAGLVRLKVGLGSQTTCKSSKHLHHSPTPALNISRLRGQRKESLSYPLVCVAFVLVAMLINFGRRPKRETRCVFFSTSDRAKEHVVNCFQCPEPKIMSPRGVCIRSGGHIYWHPYHIAMIAAPTSISVTR